MIEVSYVEYEGVKYPVRDCIFIHKGRTLRRKIGSDELGEVLAGCEGYADSTAEMIDGMIQYYVPQDKLMTLGNDDLLKYIHDYVDEGIYDDF
jgi:hypothetical protein